MNPSPVATYRLQLTPAFGFGDAAAVVPHLARLGISHIYLSPIFEAVPGSTHGYDQTNPNRLRAQFGGPAAFDNLSNAARQADLQLLVDIVPNHMAAHHDNPWWWGLLAEGPGSRFDRYFDVDWDAADSRIILPVLARTLEETIDSHQISIERDAGGRPYVAYFDRRFPLRDESVRALLAAPAPATGPALWKVLSDQHYCLEFWRTGLDRLNYRRFFDIPDLPALRIDDPRVFDELHAGVFELVRAGAIHGVRIDHVDGLADPRAYCRRLRRGLVAAAPHRHTWVLVEKILAPGESLPADWGIDGTTGYEFLAASAALQTSPDGLAALRRDAASHRAAPHDFESLRVTCKLLAAERLTPELSRVTRLFTAALSAARIPRGAGSIRRCLMHLGAHLHAYRTYIDQRGVCGAEAERLDLATRLARRTLPDSDHRTLDSLCDLLHLDAPFSEGDSRAAALAAITLFQQFTGPMAAKGVEDTALYQDAALPSLNDVGSEPVLREPSQAMQSLLTDRAAHWPLALNTTATHDTKRGEDTRARIAALSWAPALVIDALADARRACAAIQPLTRMGPAPEPVALSLILHTLVALLPLDADPPPELAARLKAYLLKASREAKIRTNWLDPDTQYEAVGDCFIDSLFSTPAGSDALQSLRRIASITRPRAALESLASILLKVLSPGVPDIYQGGESIDLSLVDPDNRRPVPWSVHQCLLGDLKSAWNRHPPSAARDHLADLSSPRAKLFITWRALALRRHLLRLDSSLRIATFESTPGYRRWTLVAGGTTATASIEFADSLAPHPPGLNQLSGSSDASRLRVVLHGVDSLVC
ncbi:MAG: malto-oligosyltrehalose synthase [Phycisphaerales bacterium]